MAGFETIHWSAVGRPSALDSEILEYARTNGWTVFTHDLDFGALLAKQQTRQPSVLQIRTQDVLPVAIGDIVLRTLRLCHLQLEEGALVTVDLKRERIRLLPL